MRSFHVIVPTVCLMLFSVCGKPEQALKFTDETSAPTEYLQVHQQIISLAPNVTEAVFFIGGGHRIAAATDYCDYPPEAESLPSTGGMLSPSIERIAAHDPGMVIASYEGNLPDLAESLAVAEIPLYTMRVQSIDGLLTSLSNLGVLLDCSTTAQTAITGLQTTLEAIANAAPGARLFFHFGDADHVYTFGKNTLVSELCSIAGAVNLGDAGTGRFPAMNHEMLAALQPDAVILLFDEEERTAAAASRLLWDALSPESRVLSIPPDPMLRPGPRLIQAFADLLEAL